jgi:hypothetical protein
MVRMARADDGGCSCRRLHDVAEYEIVAEWMTASRSGVTGTWMMAARGKVRWSWDYFGLSSRRSMSLPVRSNNIL